MGTQKLVGGIKKARFYLRVHKVIVTTDYYTTY